MHFYLRMKILHVCGLTIISINIAESLKAGMEN
jgi:hypothetical protein